MTNGNNSEIFSCVITSRIRLARNLSDYPFRVDDDYASKNIIKTIKKSLIKCGEFTLYNLNRLSDVQLEYLKERHLVSQTLIDNKDFSAALISADKTLSVMIHEEDVIREQCFQDGFSLMTCYKKLVKIDEEIAKNLDIAYDEEFGYLTACPTNLGTGLRASVMMFLPALTESGQIDELIKIMDKKGLTVRGLYGEGSSAEGYVYQISNEVTLGFSEYKILQEVEKAVRQICLAERDEMLKRYAKDDYETIDQAKKAFGILTNAVLLDYNEFLRYIAKVKLGSMLGMLNISNISEIDELITLVRPANLSVHYGREFNPTEMRLYRAELVRERLQKLIND